MSLVFGKLHTLGPVLHHLDLSVVVIVVAGHLRLMCLEDVLCSVSLVDPVQGFLI